MMYPRLKSDWASARIENARMRDATINLR